MKIQMKGVRGTIATPYMDKMKTGGNTTCIEICTDDKEIIILDAGTGLVSLGHDIIQRFTGKQIPKVHLFLTHTHWDHIDGLTFFEMLFCENVSINIYAPKRESSIEGIVKALFSDNFCPIDLTNLPCRLEFFDIEEKTITLSNGTKITSKNHTHPGGAYSYRVEYKGKVFVFNTDVEHLGGVIDQRVVEISKDADLMLHDAQYTEKQLITRVGWGHSSWQQAVEVAKLAGVKQLGLTHHDPYRTDKEINTLEKKVKKQFENSFFCKEGMEIKL